MTDSYLIDKQCNIISFDIGVKHLAYCTLYTENNYNFGIFDITATQPINRLHKLREYLDTLPSTLLVVIEQQVITNSVAMNIQSAIAMYFISKDIEVRFYNPKDKFKVDNLKKFKGKEHKQVSISYARNIIEKTNITMLSKFESFKKKDDIADALCMSLFTYVQQHNSKEYNKKIASLIHS